MILAVPTAPSRNRRRRLRSDEQDRQAVGELFLQPFVSYHATESLMLILTLQSEMTANWEDQLEGTCRHTPGCTGKDMNVGDISHALRNINAASSSKSP